MRRARGIRSDDDHPLIARRRLEALSPLAVLGRGYSITSREGRREALRGTIGVEAGDRLVTRLASGSLVSEVVDIRPESV